MIIVVYPLLVPIDQQLFRYIYMLLVHIVDGVKYCILLFTDVVQHVDVCNCVCFAYYLCVVVFLCLLLYYFFLVRLVLTKSWSLEEVYTVNSSEDRQ